MNVLFVCTRKKGYINPFISEQADALARRGVKIDYFFVSGRGLGGYFRSYRRLMKRLQGERVDLIHSHYGLSGLLACVQRKVPVVITFHGSDVNLKRVRPLSFLAARLSAHNIFVEKGLAGKLRMKRRFSIVPCGIDMDNFRLWTRDEARAALGLPATCDIVLFASAFDNPVKNASLAKKAIQKIDNVLMLELKGYTRQEICFLMNAADVLLLTSFSEGSPQVVKEAMACNLPVVSTDVGDVRQLFTDTIGNYIVPYDADAIAFTLKEILTYKIRSNARKKISDFANTAVAMKVHKIYDHSVRLSSRPPVLAGSH